MTYKGIKIINLSSNKGNKLKPKKKNLPVKLAKIRKKDSV